MIILITAPSHTGKTVLAQRILEKYHIPYMSADHLKMGLIRSGYTDLTPEGDDKLTEYLWPVEREIIKTAAENGQSLVIEGCYVPFDWRRDFDDEYLRSIRFVCLVMTERYIDEHFADIAAHASDMEKRPDDDDLTAEDMKADSRRYFAGFENAGEKVYCIDRNFEDTVRRILDDIG